MIEQIGIKAVKASRILALAGEEEKNRALRAIAKALIDKTGEILAANDEDVRCAHSNGIKPVMVDRLRLTSERIVKISEAVLELCALPDPVGRIISGEKRPNGLIIEKKRVPLGVVGIIYETRPNVTVDAAALCLKSGNACILRGGRGALYSNLTLCEIMRAAILDAGLPEDAINLLNDSTHEGAEEMMKARGILDVLIPRGGAGLIRSVVENSSVPVIETGVGNCHIYVEKSAKADMAVNIVFNAKTSRPSVCNAAESLLIDEAAAQTLLPAIASELAKKNVEIRGCEKTREILGDFVKEATDEDYGTEFLDYIISVKVVGGIDEAITHITKYGSGHSEAIVTSDCFAAEKFLNEVDAAAVYINASTRFSDGNEFGLGAEIGISTQKLHVRGPMGLEALTSTKYTVRGNGQIR